MNSHTEDRTSSLKVKAYSPNERTNACGGTCSVFNLCIAVVTDTTMICILVPLQILEPESLLDGTINLIF